MKIHLLDWVIILAMPVIAWIISSISRKKSGQFGSYRGYFLAKRTLSTGTVTAALIGTNITFTTIFLVLSDEAFKRGWVVMCVPVFWLMGSVLFVALYGRIKTHIRDGRTLHQSLGEAYNSTLLRKWAAVWTLVAFVGTVALEFYGAIILFRWTGISDIASVAIAVGVAFVVSAFTASGGMRGVAWADIFLDGLTFIAAGILFYFTLAERSVLFATKIPVETLQSSPTDTLLFVGSMMCLFVPFQFCTLDTWQRLLAWGKKDRNPSSWIIFGGIAVAVGFSIPIAIGSLSHGMIVKGEGSEHILGDIIGLLNLGTPLIGICLAGLAGAVLSTADELLNCSSMTLIADVWGVSFSGERSITKDERLETSGKLYTGIFAFLAALLALIALKFGREISDIALAVFSAQVSFAWPLAGLMFCANSTRHKSGAAIWAMATASLMAVGAVFYGWIADDRAAVDGAPVLAFVASGIVFWILWVCLPQKIE